MVRQRGRVAARWPGGTAARDSGHGRAGKRWESGRRRSLPHDEPSAAVEGDEEAARQRNGGAAVLRNSSSGAARVGEARRRRRGSMGVRGCAAGFIGADEGLGVRAKA